MHAMFRVFALSTALLAAAGCATNVSTTTDESEAPGTEGPSEEYGAESAAPNVAPPAGVGAIGSSAGRTIHVSTSGNDANSGTSTGAAVRTAGKALSLARAGDTILFAAGTYPPLTVQNKSGASGAPITLRASGTVSFTSGSYDRSACILVKNAAHLVVDGFVAKRCLWGILVEGARNVTIRRNLVQDIGQEGIHVRLASESVLIHRNRIHALGKRGGEYVRWGEGIYIGYGADGGENDGTKNVVANGNEIWDTGSEAIDLKRGLRDIVAEYNDIHDIATNVRAIVNVNDHPTGKEQGYVVRGNVIRRGKGVRYDSDGVGIRIFGGGVDVYNNVVSSMQFAGIRNEAKSGSVRIWNNTVYQGGTRGDIVDETGIADVRNNIGSSKSGNIRASSGLFVDAAGGDFRLSTGSAARDKGVTLSLVSIDIVGNKRPSGGAYDLGAYEMP
jgi:hypothetical protein